MTTSLDSRCRRCGRPHAADEVACALCGELFRRASDAGSVHGRRRDAETSSPRSNDEDVTVATVAAPSSLLGAAPATSTSAMPPSTPSSTISRTRPSARATHAVTSTSTTSTVADLGGDDGVDASRPWSPWLHWGVGAAASVVFLWLPFTAWMCWFLASLVHEMGHAACAWFFGMPAIPVISLAGEAAAVHQDQSTFLVACVTVALVGLAWRFLEGRSRWITIACVVPTYLALAFTDGKELLHLSAGHGAELVFAGVCLFRALDGGFTESAAERVTYAMLGWAIWARNVSLCFGLATSADARAQYEGSGSFGLTNDYLRIAHDVTNTSVSSVAVVMLFAAACVAPAAVGVWRLRSR